MRLLYSFVYNIVLVVGVMTVQSDAFTVPQERTRSVTCNGRRCGPFDPHLSSSTALYLSDIPQDESKRNSNSKRNSRNNSPVLESYSGSSSSTESIPKTQRQRQKQQQMHKQRQQQQQNGELQELQRLNGNNNIIDNCSSDGGNSWYSNGRGWFPEPPEDGLTLAGDITSLFLYTFTDHYLNNLWIEDVFRDASVSAVDAAKTLDPSGFSIALSNTPVWLDTTAWSGSGDLENQVLLLDLQSRVTPHFTPLLSDVGVASVALASCWLLAGLVHKSFHFRNTLDCSTNRAVIVTGKTWLTASFLLIGMALLSHYIMLAAATATAVPLAAAVDDPVTASNTAQMTAMMQGHKSADLTMQAQAVVPAVEEWFNVLTKSDADFVVGSLSVVLMWRFLMSVLVGGWSK